MAAAAHRTVVVVNSATPVIMPWIDEVDAVLWAGLPGQEGGHAIAAALLGHIEPAGRLVTTFPTDDGDTPAWSVTPVDGDLVYSEGTSIGYRGHYAGAAPEPAFWLGHGLGYSEWDYGTADSSIRRPGSRARSSVTVTQHRHPAQPRGRAGLLPAGRARPAGPAGRLAVRRPCEPGASATVQVTPDARMWRRWDEASSGWQQLSAGGELLVARGLGDIRTSVELP